MEGKKISFGFTKIKKESKVVLVEKKEYIDCVEEKSIKVVGGDAKDETGPLVIPMKPNTLITAEKLKEIAIEAENFDELEIKKEPDEVKKVIIKDVSLYQMAVRELLEDATKEKNIEKPNLVVPINVKPVLTGQAEATLDDYESVPIQEYGMAMLRGMGWTPNKDQSTYKQPQLRPKGLGLGADKMVKENQTKKGSKDKEEELSIVKNSYVKVTSGKYSGHYGKVVSLDEDNGRVVVDITMKKETVSLSEFMMQAVTKSEFDKQSKVINSESYEEYKIKDMLNTKQFNSKSDDLKSASSSRQNEIRQRDLESEESAEERLKKNDHSNGKDRGRDSSEDRRHRHKYKKRYSSNDSLSSDPEQPRRRRKSSSGSSGYGRKVKSKKNKRDIDKKRKGKKKKRDRDRSPSYKKYKK